MLLWCDAEQKPTHVKFRITLIIYLIWNINKAAKISLHELATINSMRNVYLMWKWKHSQSESKLSTYL